MLVAVALVACFSLVQFVLVLRLVRAIPSPPRAAPRGDRWPTLSVVTPARDEALQIKSALLSKLSCGYRELELIAVDDRSTDATGALMREVAAADSRVRILRVDALPEGWLGKLHALARGLDEATGEWVLFSDADVHLAPGALDDIVAYAQAEAADFVAVLPQMEPVGWWLDACAAVFLRTIGIAGRVWRANDDQSSFGFGVGAFCLARRDVLLRTNAIEHLRMEVADDLALGALLKQSGARCRLLAGDRRVHLKWLPSLRAMARSFDKAGGTMDFSFWKALAAGAIPLDFLIALIALARPGPARWLGAASLALATAMHLVVAWRFAAPLRGALLWPAGAVLMSALTWRSGFLAWWRQGVFWRDTFYGREVLQRGRRLSIRSLRVAPSAPDAARATP